NQMPSPFYTPPSFYSSGTLFVSNSKHTLSSPAVITAPSGPCTNPRIASLCPLHVPLRLPVRTSHRFNLPSNPTVVSVLGSAPESLVANSTLTTAPSCASSMVLRTAKFREASYKTSLPSTPPLARSGSIGLMLKLSDSTPSSWTAMLATIVPAASPPGFFLPGNLAAAGRATTLHSPLAPPTTTSVPAGCTATAYSPPSIENRWSRDVSPTSPCPVAASQTYKLPSSDTVQMSRPEGVHAPA